MKKSNFTYRLLTIALIFILIAVPAATVSADSNLPVTQGCRTMDAQIPILNTSKDLTNLFSAFLFDTTNDTLIYSVNPDARYSPASLVKIMTGLLIAQKSDLSEQVTVRQDVLDTLSAESITTGFQNGEIVTMRDLLYCTLVQSANEAAAIAADHISGSQEAFVREMNSYAAELGCTNTNFVNVHGLHDESQYSSARDIAKILSAAIKNDVFMDAFSAAKYTVPATNLSESRELTSTNYLMTQYDYLDTRVTGGRTGIVNSGERNLAVAAQDEDVQLICVVLGSATKFSDDGRKIITYGSFHETSELLDMGFMQQQSVQLFYENQVLKQFEVANGDSDVTVCVMDSTSTLLPQGVTQADLTYRYTESGAGIQAPIKSGDVISSVQIWYEDLCLAQTDLYALHDVDVKEVTETEIIDSEASSGMRMVFISVAVIVGLLLILLFGQRIIFKIIHHRRIRRRKKNRRRSR